MNFFVLTSVNVVIVNDKLIYIIKIHFTDRTSVDVKPGLISSKQHWIDVNGLNLRTKEIHANMICSIKRCDWLLNVHSIQVI